MIPRSAGLLARYQAYEAYLAGHIIGRAFGQAGEFLNLVAANALFTIGTDRHARR